jgi:hypothetical protein
MSNGRNTVVLSLAELEGTVVPVGGDREGLLVVCASYEDRSTAAAGRLAPEYKAKSGAIFLSKEYGDKGKTREHFRYISKALASHCETPPQVIDFSIDRPMPSMTRFENMCLQLLPDRVTVDITTFPRQELLMLLRVLDSLPNNPMIRLVYAEPEMYGTESGDGWLTRGVRAVRTVPGFGGVQPPGKEKLLVMFLGHEEERAAIIWKRHQPRMTIAIVPDPGYRKGLNGMVERIHGLLLTRIRTTQMHPAISARGINSAKETVLNLWDQYHERYFLVVAPLSTKLQMLGIYQAVRQRPDIQITYAIPAAYNFNDYSTGVGKVWQVVWNYGSPRVG